MGGKLNRRKKITQGNVSMREPALRSQGIIILHFAIYVPITLDKAPGLHKPT